MAKIIGEGITFDDVLLVPHYSDLVPNEVDLSTYLTKTMMFYWFRIIQTLCRMRWI